MVSGVENNNLLNNHSLHVGVLYPPNELHKPVLYSHSEADRQFKQLEKDIYQTEKSQKFENKRRDLKKKVEYIIVELIIIYLWSE